MILWLLMGVFLIPGCRNAENGRAMLLMRHFAPAELAQVEAGELPCCFDLAVFGADHGAIYPRARSAFQTQGKGLVAYFNVHDVQPQVTRREWRTPWFSFVADTLMAEWDGYLRSATGDTAFYAFYGGDRYFVNWAQVDSSRAEILVAAMKRAAGPHAAAFWDVYWPKLDAWMFASRGASLESIPLAVRTQYTANIERALRIARRRFEKNGQRVPFAVIVNGAWTSPPPIYLESMEQTPLGTFRHGCTLWASHSRNVGSVKAHHTAWVDSALEQWKRTGGILAFTGDAEELGVHAAYCKAESVRTE